MSLKGQIARGKKYLERMNADTERNLTVPMQVKELGEEHPDIIAYKNSLGGDPNTVTKKKRKKNNRGKNSSSFQKQEKQGRKGRRSKKINRGRN